MKSVIVWREYAWDTDKVIPYSAGGFETFPEHIITVRKIDHKEYVTSDNPALPFDVIALNKFSRRIGSGSHQGLRLLMGVIRDILSQVATAIDSVSETGFAASAGQVGDVIPIGSIVLLIIPGINVVMQLRPMSFGSFFAFGIKLTQISIFAQTWANFEVVCQIVTDVPDAVGARILALTRSGNKADVYENLDGMVARITACDDAIGDGAGWVFNAVPGAIFFVLSALFAAITAGIIYFAKIVFTVMIVIAPFMILCSLFKLWVRTTIGYALISVAAARAAGIIVAIASAIGTTASGKRAIARTIRLPDESEAFAQEMKGGRSTCSGEVRVGAFTSISPNIAPLVIRNLRESHPDMIVHLPEGDIMSIRQSLRNGVVDVLLTYDPVYGRSLKPGF